MKHTWLLDAGHGGMTRAGVYTTAPSKMHVFPDGLTFYEGVNNRAIVEKLSDLLIEARIDHTMIHDPEHDTPLKERVFRANHLYAKDKRCIYLSIHSDAMPAGSHGKGSGFSVYTSIGHTQSDAIAEIFCATYLRRLPQFKFRRNLTDGDMDHEENFYVLKNTSCPALLVENLFFDNRKEAEFLLSDAGQSQIAMTLFEAILATEKEGVRRQETGVRSQEIPRDQEFPRPLPLKGDDEFPHIRRPETQNPEHATTQTLKHSDTQTH